MGLGDLIRRILIGVGVVGAIHLGIVSQPKISHSIKPENQSPAVTLEDKQDYRRYAAPLVLASPLLVLLGWYALKKQRKSLWDAREQPLEAALASCAVGLGATYCLANLNFDPLTLEHANLFAGITCLESAGFWLLLDQLRRVKKPSLVKYFQLLTLSLKSVFCKNKSTIDAIKSIDWAESENPNRMLLYEYIKHKDYVNAFNHLEKALHGKKGRSLVQRLEQWATLRAHDVAKIVNAEEWHLENALVSAAAGKHSRACIALGKLGNAELDYLILGAEIAERLRKSYPKSNNIASELWQEYLARMKEKMAAIGAHQVFELPFTISQLANYAHIVKKGKEIVLNDEKSNLEEQSRILKDEDRIDVSRLDSPVALRVLTEGQDAYLIERRIQGELLAKKQEPEWFALAARYLALCHARSKLQAACFDYPARLAERAPKIQHFLPETLASLCDYLNTHPRVFDEDGHAKNFVVGSKLTKFDRETKALVSPAHDIGRLFLYANQDSEEAIEESYLKTCEQLNSPLKLNVGILALGHAFAAFDYSFTAFNIHREGLPRMLSYAALHVRRKIDSIYGGENQKKIANALDRFAEIIT